MIKKICAVVLMMGAAILCGCATSRPLFDKDLGNTLRDPGIWSVTPEGWLTATEDKNIWTAAQYRDFELTLDYRCGPAANSGVFLYVKDTTNWMGGHVEIQILDDAAPKWQKAPPTWHTGGLFGHTVPLASPGRPAGEWNTLRIVSQGTHLRVWVNGTLTADADLKAWTNNRKNPDGSAIPPWLTAVWADLEPVGHIGFQGKHGGAPIHFRNLQIRELK